MKTNISKKQLKAKLENLLERIRDIGAFVGNPELNYMTDAYQDRCADFERMLDGFIDRVDGLTPPKKKGHE